MADSFANLHEASKILKVTPGKLTKHFREHIVESYSTGQIRRMSSQTYSDGNFSARFKMFIQQVKVSKQCMSYLKNHLNKDIFVTLKWSFFDIEDSVTSPDKLDQNRAKFDFTLKYPLELDEDFIVNKLTDNPVTFKLYASCDGEELFLSAAQFFIGDIVEVVNVKQEQRLYFTCNDIDASGEIIAYLDIWYKFTCKQKILRTLFPTTKLEAKKKSSTKMIDLLGEKFSKRSQNFSSVHVTESEFDHFADSVLLVLNRNKVLKNTQSDINNELQERVRWLRFEANWKQTLQENAIIHGKNPENVVWRQWREEDTANVRLRTYDDLTPQTYVPQVSITVVDLYFLEGCPLLKNDDIRKFYVEYSFLGFEGPEMETPFSIPKEKADERVVFNFQKVFPIDIAENHDNCKTLTDLIKADGSIKFIVISEPEEDINRPIQTCQEVGYAEVSLNELIQLQENEDTYEYEIIDSNNSIVVMGYLTIKIKGILAIRKMALKFMAPKGYKLFM